MSPLMSMLFTYASSNSNPPWVATSGPVTVAVDRTNFRYSVTVDGGEAWLADGRVAIQCGGERFSSTTNLTGGTIRVVNGSCAGLGTFIAIERTWTAGTCTSLTTSIRQFARGAIEFATRLSGRGASRTNVSEPGTPVLVGTKLATEFPSFALPTASSFGLITWRGNSLRDATVHLPQPADLQKNWSGGLEGGPLVLYSEAPKGGNIVAAVLGPSR